LKFLEKKALKENRILMIL